MTLGRTSIFPEIVQRSSFMPEPFLLNTCIFINQGHFCKRSRQNFAMVTRYDVIIDIK